MAGSESLSFPESEAVKLQGYLPPADQECATRGRPFVTLTFATSLDSSLALAAGTRTALSGPGSKAMTHHLRSKHAAICVGVGTAVADDPALNCRIEGNASQPRPVILDPRARWRVTWGSAVLDKVRKGQGKAPLVLTGLTDPPWDAVAVIEEHGGKYVTLDVDGSGRFRWADVLATLLKEGLHSVMVEGGGSVINSLLDATNHDLVDSVIVTIAPTWLGRGGVVVSPERRYDGSTPVPAARLIDTAWIPLGEDMVLCGRL